MNDHYIRAISATKGLRLLVCTVDNSAREICSMQGASPTASVALGRGLAAVALMGGLLKAPERIALKFEGNGPLRQMIVEAESDGAIRGCIKVPEADVEPLDGKWNVPGLLGRAGFLTVTKDIGSGKEPYSGTVQLHSSEVGDDLALYLTESEQTPSAVGVGVSLDEACMVAFCGGFLVQALPGADDDEIGVMLDRIASLEPISAILAEGGTEALLERLTSGLEFTRLETRELFFRCGCSRERVELALHSLGWETLRDMAKNDGGAEVRCEFCRQGYAFDSEELARLELLAQLPAT